MSVPKILNAFVDGTRTVFLHRAEDGRLMSRSAPAEYSCFLDVVDAGEDVMRQLRKSAYVAGLTVEGQWARVRWRDRWLRRKACDPEGWFQKKGIKVYEGDVDPIRRVFADTGAEIAKPRRAYVDIETDSRKNFVQAKAGEARVLSWAISGEQGPVAAQMLEADSDAAEAELLSGFWQACDPFDQLLAWSGDDFDFPVLFERSNRTGARAKDYRRWLYLDHLALFKRMNMHAADSGEEKQSMKLENIAQAVLGEGKDPFDGSKTWAAWAEGGDEAARLLRYNVKDADLLRKLERKLGYADLFQAVCEVCRVLPNTRGLGPAEQLDGYMLRLARERGIHFGTKKFEAEEYEGQYAGAYVMPPAVRGIEHDVHVCDFAAMYPSIIVTWNMSPDTKANDVPVNGAIPLNRCRAPGSSTRVGFVTDRVGILPGALKEMIDKRSYYAKLKASLTPGTPEWRDADRKSTAYKVVANSFYGVSGSPFSRFYDREIAEAVTQNGVWLLKRVIDEVGRRKWAVKYGDTDSAFASGCTDEEFREFVRWCNVELFPKLVADNGCATNMISLAYEKKFARLVMTSAKKYVGVYAHYKGKPATSESKPEIKGLEWKRGDVSLLARQLQGRLIDIFVEGDEVPARYRAVIAEERKRVLEGDLTVDEVKLAKSISRDVDAYAVKVKKDGSDGASPPHVVIARLLKARGENVSEGTRIEYVVVDGVREGGIGVIPASDYRGRCDRYYLWDKLVFPATERLVVAMFPDEDWTDLARARPSKREQKALAGGQVGLGIAQEKKARPRRSKKGTETQFSLLVQGAAPPTGSRPAVPSAPAAPAAPTYPAPIGGVAVRFNPGNYGRDKSDTITRILKRYPGTGQVVVYARHDSGALTIRFNERVTVSEDLLDALAAVADDVEAA